MATILGGLVGGLVATIVMTVAMMGIQRAIGEASPPPTAALWAQYVGDGDPADYQMQGMILHLLYGTVAGGVFVAIAGALAFVALGTIADAVLWGVVYAIVLFVVGAVVWLMVVLGIQPNRRTGTAFLVNHLVYGVVLGAWVSVAPLGL